MRFIFIALCIICTPLASENKTENPLFKALSGAEEAIEELIHLKSENYGFIPVDFCASLEANWIPTEENFFSDVGIQIVKHRFEQFCGEFTKLSRADQIPHTIHLIWLGSAVPKKVDLAILSWKIHNPDWNIKLWTDSDMKEFAWSSNHSQSIFELGKNWAEKSDILRLEILYQFGGIYADTDVVCLKPLDDLCLEGISFFAGLESNKIKRFGRPLVGSAILGSAKSSLVIKRCIECTQSAEQAPAIHQHLRSGPGPVTTACYEALESGDTTVLILPCSYFYPLPWEKRLSTPSELIENIKPESFAVHLWEGTWFDDYYPPLHPKYIPKYTASGLKL